MGLTLLSSRFSVCPFLSVFKTASFPMQNISLSLNEQYLATVSDLIVPDQWAPSLSYSLLSCLSIQNTPIISHCAIAVVFPSDEYRFTLVPFKLSAEEIDVLPEISQLSSGFAAQDLSVLPDLPQFCSASSSDIDVLTAQFSH